MLSQMDDYPPHQIADVMRFVGTSERYYFKLHASSDELFMVMGLVDHAERFELSTGEVGHGLFEYGFFGQFDQYGIK